MTKKIQFFLIASAFAMSSLFADESVTAEKTAPIKADENAVSEQKKPEAAPASVETKENDGKISAAKPAKVNKTKIEMPVVKAEKAENNVILTIKEIFRVMEKNYPALMKEVENEKIRKERVLENFTASFGAGVKLIETGKTEETKKSLTKEIKKKNYFPIVNISSNKISYFRIDEFNGKVFEPFKSDCEMVAALAKPPVGIIIDLRNCSGSNYKDALKCLLLLCKGKSLPDIPGKEKVKESFNLPTAVLIGEKTSGAAEVFVYWIAKARQGLTIGENSAGKPFPEKRFDLKSEKYTLLIPEIPDYLSEMVVENPKPSINLDAYPQISYKKISEESQSEKSDKCLLRAVDLLISLNALENQWKK